MKKQIFYVMDYDLNRTKSKPLSLKPQLIKNCLLVMKSHCENVSPHGCFWNAVSEWICQTLKNKNHAWRDIHYENYSPTIMVSIVLIKTCNMSCGLSIRTYVNDELSRNYLQHPKDSVIYLTHMFHLWIKISQKIDCF